MLKKIPHGDFKPLTMQALGEQQSSHIIFAVDDIIVKDFINLQHDAKLLDRTHAYGFFYRLGQNVDFCYAVNRFQGIPSLINLQQDLLAWQFAWGKDDWNYPNCVDMTLYRKADIVTLISRLHFSAPNTFEGHWAGHADSSKLGLCHLESKMVNIPTNSVQDVFGTN